MHIVWMLLLCIGRRGANGSETSNVKLMNLSIVSNRGQLSDAAIGNER